jgi:hypothetical protein
MSAPKPVNEWEEREIVDVDGTSKTGSRVVFRAIGPKRPETRRR